jgi:hypothetical protein
MTLTNKERQIAGLAEAFASGKTFAVTVDHSQTESSTYIVYAANNKAAEKLVLEKSNAHHVTGVRECQLKFDW